MLQLAIQKEILLGSQKWSQVGVLPSKHLPQHFPWEIIKLVVGHTVFFGQADQPDLPLILNHPPPLCPNKTVLSAGFGMRRLPGAFKIPTDTIKGHELLKMKAPNVMIFPISNWVSERFFENQSYLTTLVLSQNLWLKKCVYSQHLDRNMSVEKLNLDVP